jgi:hypothetical protein
MLALNERGAELLTRPADNIPKMPPRIPPQDPATWTGCCVEVLAEDLLGFYSQGLAGADGFGHGVPNLNGSGQRTPLRNPSQVLLDEFH